MCKDLVVEGDRGKARGKKTWQECVDEEMKQMRVKKCDAHDRAVWRNGVFLETSNQR
jgi:hypothetical protein